MKIKVVRKVPFNAKPSVYCPLLVADDEPARAIVARRAWRGICRVIERAPLDVMTEAASASTDVAVLVRALEQPEAIEILKTDDPLAPARLRGLRERECLLSVEGGTWNADRVAEHLHLTRQAVNRRRQQGTLLGMHAGRHGYWYPAWQFVREGIVKGLELVLEALAYHDAWMQQAFMVTENDRLAGVSPIQALRRGRLDEVLRAARAYGEHGAA